MTTAATDSTTLTIVPSSIAVLVEPDGAAVRYGVTGELALAGDLALERVRVALIGRAGERVVVVDDTSLEREAVIDGRLPFASNLNVKSQVALTTLEVRAYASGSVQLGAGRVASADVPVATDGARGPLALDLGGARLSVQQRPEPSEVNLDIFGVAASDAPRLTRVAVELVCLDADERPLFRDDSSFDLSFGAPACFRVVFWPKIGGWRATRSLLVRVRGEVMAQAEPVVVEAARFERVAPPED